MNETNAEKEQPKMKLIMMEIHGLYEVRNPDGWKRFFKKSVKREYGVVLKDERSPDREMIVFVDEFAFMTISAYIVAANGLNKVQPDASFDIFQNAFDTFGYKLNSIIFRGITREIQFVVDISFTNGQDTWTCSLTPADALTMAVKCNHPVFVNEEFCDWLQKHNQKDAMLLNRRVNWLHKAAAYKLPE
jgi:bifunctional DNase/RNase